jgi:hypothetical protein
MISEALHRARTWAIPLERYFTAFPQVLNRLRLWSTTIPLFLNPFETVYLSWVGI